VPISAVRQLGDDFFIVIAAADDATERVTITVGTSDGVSVEVLDGLAAGVTILIGADSAGVPFSATQQLQTTPQGFGGGGGFGGFGGGGGR
jgi:multidrug efflux pump subunit AcrA (membrane-fusion protein)